jgi:hypothetical protein
VVAATPSTAAQSTVQLLLRAVSDSGADHVAKQLEWWPAQPAIQEYQRPQVKASLDRCTGEVFSSNQERSLSSPDEFGATSGFRPPLPLPRAMVAGAVIAVKTGSRVTPPYTEGP